MITPDESTSPRSGSVNWFLLALLSLWFLVLYLGIVLPFDAFLPWLHSYYFGPPVVILSFVATYDFLRRWRSRGRAEEARTRLQKMAFLCIMLLACFLVVDIGNSVYLNVIQGPGEGSKLLASRETDPHTWDGELMPQLYYPTKDNFFLYKPSETSSGYSYGELYYPALLQHRLLKESVLQLRKVEYSIDQYGLRNTHPSEEASIFALGDSFCFGYHMTQVATWPELMQRNLGQPVYNLGVSGTSPYQQLLQLRYLIDTYPESFKPKHLLWLVFEGNDLEIGYEVQRGIRGELSRAFEGTIIQSLATETANVREESLIRKIVDGRISLKWPAGQGTKPQVLEGAQLAYPLHHSRRFGYKMFRPEYVERATMPESYVLEHPNLPRVEDTFRKMRALGQEKGFEVTVVLVPSDARLYKDDFESFPPMSEDPYFLKYVKELSAEVGFASIDLTELLQPYAAEELLYQRDDSHWNERGHEIVAKLIQQKAHLQVP